MWMSLSKKCRVPSSPETKSKQDQSHGITPVLPDITSRLGLCRNPYPLFIYCESRPTTTISFKFQNFLNITSTGFPGTVSLTHFSRVSQRLGNSDKHTHSLTHSLTHTHFNTLQQTLQHTHTVTNTYDGPPLGIGESSYTHQLVSDQHH